MIDILPDSVNQTIDVFIQDSSSTTGEGLTGLVYNTGSLVCYYRRGATGSATALSLATQTVGGAHSDGGFVEISSANMPGVYRLDLSDAIVASGVPYVTVMLHGATNMAPTLVRINLEDKVSVTDILSDGAPLNTTSGAIDTVSTVSSLGATAKADVNAEVVDALSTDTYAELTSVPGATAAISSMIRFIYLLSRNKIAENSATETQTIYQDDGSTVFAEATVQTSGTTTTRGELTTA